LSRALTALRKRGIEDDNFQKTKISTLNPKSIKMEELYGCFNLNTGEW
jgi:hypothetical protein